jgi:hypothetical protein
MAPIPAVVVGTLLSIARRLKPINPGVESHFLYILDMSRLTKGNWSSLLLVRSFPGVLAHDSSIYPKYDRLHPRELLCVSWARFRSYYLSKHLGFLVFEMMDSND